MSRTGTLEEMLAAAKADGEDFFDGYLKPGGDCKYVVYTEGKPYITLDADLTADELEAAAAFVRKHQRN